MTRVEIRKDFIKNAKYGITAFGIKINMPTFMFRKHKAQLWDSNFNLRKAIYKKLFSQDLVSIYDLKDWIEEEYAKE